MRIGKLIVSTVPRWTWGQLREAGLHSFDLGCICLEWVYTEEHDGHCTCPDCLDDLESRMDYE